MQCFGGNVLDDEPNSTAFNLEPRYSVINIFKTWVRCALSSVLGGQPRGLANLDCLRNFWSLPDQFPWKTPTSRTGNSFSSLWQHSQPYRVTPLDVLWYFCFHYKIIDLYIANLHPSFFLILPYSHPPAQSFILLPA